MSDHYPPPQAPNDGPYGGPPQGPPGAGGFTGPQYGGPPPAQQDNDGGFFGALFDFSFSRFVTPYIVKFVYVLALVGLVLTWLIMTIAGFSDSAVGGLAILLIGAVAILIYLAFIRMTLEFYLAVVRMSEDIHQRLPRG